MAVKRIIVKGNESTIQKEGEAVAAITPGALVELGTAIGTVQVHGTAEGFAQKAFCVEAGFIGTDIDDDYAAEDQVVYVVCAPGVEINALVADGTAAIAKGDGLVSAGDGTLVSAGAVTATEAQCQVVGVALEAVDNSGGSAPVRILIAVV